MRPSTCFGLHWAPSCEMREPEPRRQQSPQHTASHLDRGGGGCHAGGVGALSLPSPWFSGPSSALPLGSASRVPPSFARKLSLPPGCLPDSGSGFGHLDAEPSYQGPFPSQIAFDQFHFCLKLKHRTYQSQAVTA